MPACLHREGLVVANSTIPEAEGSAGIPVLPLTGCGIMASYFTPHAPVFASVKGVLRAALLTIAER